MYRVNQIIKTISNMNSYAPYNQINKKSNLLRKVQVYSFLTSLFSLILMVIMAVIYKVFDLPNNHLFYLHSSCMPSIQLPV